MSNDGSVLALRFSNDDRELTSLAKGRYGNVVFVRKDLLRATDLIDGVCTRLTRNLTQSEWQQYIPAEPYRKSCPNISEEPVRQQAASR